jgi:hypothetical protein
MNVNGSQNTSVGPSLLALLETKQDGNVEGTIAELESMARDLVPVLEAAKGKLQACDEKTAEYRRMARALNDQITVESAALSTFRGECVAERFDNFSAVDVVGLSQQLRTRTDALKLNQDAYSWLMEVGSQDAVEATLEATLQLRGVQKAEVSVYASLSEARTNKALSAAFAEETTLGVVGGRTSALFALVDEAIKAEAMAREALTDFRKRRAKLDVAKRAAGYITSSQVPNTF